MASSAVATATDLPARALAVYDDLEMASAPVDPEVLRILAELGLPVAVGGTVDLQHATTKASAVSIATSGVLESRVGAVYFCTHPSIIGRIVDPADGVLDVTVVASDLLVHRDIDACARFDENHPQAEFVVYTTVSGYKPAAIGDFQEYSRTAFD